MGKFDSKNKGGNVDVYQLLAQRDAANQAGQNGARRPQGSAPRGDVNPRQAMPRTEAIPGKPVGTVCMGYSINGRDFSETRYFTGDRTAVRNAAVKHILQHLIELLKTAG